MDAFSRLLNAIGQSLGKGLGQVGQTELEQRQRLEALEAQRKANISGQLLQTFTQLLNTQGIQEVDPEGIKAIQQAVTDLALGRVDSPNVQAAVSVFPKVADSANKIGVYRELATRDLDALARLIVNTNPDEAQKLLKAVGLEGMREGLRARGEILVTADQLGLQLTKEQIENLIANRQALLAKLGPEIDNLVAQKEYTKAQANAILQKLPLELTTLQLKARQLGIDVAKGEKELARFDELLNLTMEKLVGEVNMTKEQVNLLREQIKTAVLQQAKLEADTELTKAQTEATKANIEATRAETELTKKQIELTDENIKAAAQRRGIELTESAMTWLENITRRAIELSADTPEKAKELLQAFGSFYNLPGDFIDQTANQIATAVREAKADRDIQRTGAIADAIGKVMNTALAAESPEAARKVADAILPPSVNPGLRALVGDMAYYLKTLRLGSDTAAIIEPYMKTLPPTPEDESRMLRELYDSFLRAKGDTPENRRVVNGIVNTIKGQWALMRATQGLEVKAKEAGVDKDKALAALYKVQAALAPKEFGLEERKLAFEREQFSFEKWYKAEQIKLGWARLELDKLLAQAEAAGTGGDTIKALKDLASTAKALDDVAVAQLAAALRNAGHNDCANGLEKNGTTSWIEEVRGDNTKCNAVVQKILTDRNTYGGVINAVENAVRFGQMVTEMATQFLGGAPAGPSGGTQPSGTPASGGGKPSGAPSGVTGPQPQGGGATPPPNAAAAFLGRAKALKAFGVPAPKDPKTAGAMAFIYALEGGPSKNPFQILPESGVEPKGPDRGFSAAVNAEPTRQKAVEIDSAPALGLSWFLPILARNPSVKVRYLDPKYVEGNKPLFERAKYFGDDGVAVAASYTVGALERSGLSIKYTPLFTSLMRTLAENDLSALRMQRPLSQAKAEERFLNLVMSRYGNRYKEFGLNSPEELRSVARQLYQATRLSVIGQVAIGGWK